MQKVWLGQPTQPISGREKLEKRNAGFSDDYPTRF
jgi:hypothetical protein